TCRPALGRAGLERSKPERHILFHFLRRTGVRVHADAVACRAAEEFVHRHTESLAFDVPESLVDAAKSTGEHRTAAVERMAVNGLPVMGNRSWILADEIGLNFLD